MSKIQQIIEDIERAESNLGDNKDALVKSGSLKFVLRVLHQLAEEVAEMRESA